MNIKGLPYLELPESIDVEITTNCNLSCSFCQRSYSNRSGQEMTVGLYNKCLDMLPSLRSIKLHGLGEPLLNSSIYGMIARAKELGLFVWTYTNGTFLHKNDCMKRLLNSGLDLLRISIESPIKHDYESMRIGASYEELINNVTKLILLREENNSSMAVELWMVCMNSNFYQFTEFVEMGAKLKVDAVRMQSMVNTYEYKQPIGKLLEPLKIKDIGIFNSCVRTAAQRARVLGIEFELCKGKHHSEGDICPWPFKRMFVSCEGYIVPCGTIADPTVINFGSVKSQPIREIWNSSPYNEFRNLHLSGKYPEYCVQCYLNNF